MRTLFWVIACASGDPSAGEGGDSASPGADSADTGAAADSAEPEYIYDGEETTPPKFDAEAVGQTLGEVLLGARAITAEPVIAGYVEAAAGMDAGCPGWINVDDTEYWYDSCTSDAGTTFDGYATVYEYQDYRDEDGNVWDGYQYSGIATITTAEGFTFESAGAAAVLWGTTADGLGEIYYTVMEDGFSYDGPAAQGTWLAEGLSPELYTYTMDYPSLDGRALYMSGRITVEGQSVAAIVFEDLFLYSASLGSPCPEEPAGMVSVLDASGIWYDLVFDGGEWGEEVDAAYCDGCATAWYQGLYLGDVCADFSELLDWM